MVSKVGVVSVGIVGFGFDNYGLAACYTVDLVLADFVWKYFETTETEMVDGAAGFEEIVVVVVVVVVGTGIAVVVGKVIVVVVDIDHMAAVALVEQQQNFPLNDMAAAV